jgi:MFS family permease
MISRLSRPRKILGVSCAIHAIQDGLTSSIYVLLPILAQSFGLSYAQVGWLKGVKNLAQGLLEIVSGIASDRFGERLVLSGGVALSGMGYLILSQAAGAGTVLFCFVLVGIGAAFQHSPASKLVTHAFGAEARRGALGLYNSSGDAGKLTFTGMLSLGSAFAVGWQSMTLAFGLVAVLMAAVVCVMLGRLIDPQPKPETHAAAVTGWGIVDPRGFAALTAVVSLDSIVQTSVLTFIAFVMIAKGFSTFAATLAAVLVLTGGMFGKAACGYLAQNLGTRRAFAAVQLATAGGLLAVAVLPGALAYALLPFVGVVLQGSTSITYSAVNDLILPSHTARGFALIYAAGSFASIAGPLGFGVIGDWYGIETALIGMAAASALGVPSAMLLRDDPVRRG